MIERPFQDECRVRSAIPQVRVGHFRARELPLLSGRNAGAETHDSAPWALILRVPAPETCIREIRLVDAPGHGRHPLPPTLS